MILDTKILLYMETLERANSSIWWKQIINMLSKCSLKRETRENYTY